VKKLEEYLSDEGIDFNSEHNHIRCLAHVINLSVQSLLSELKAEPTHNNEQELLNKEEKTSNVVSKVSFFYFIYIYILYLTNPIRFIYIFILFFILFIYI
jgi:hypothetical protein